MVREDEILAVVRASAVRRVAGIGMMASLGALLLYIAFTRSHESIGWQVFLIVLGAGAIWMAERMRRATELAVELTPRGLRASDGELIAALDEIESLDRGFFAFKPSNGFLLRLKGKTPARWQPGLYWRLGRRVGIGGVTPGAQSRAMAEIIAVLMSERQA